jgi:uroporphyrin-III C-methyltransferase/precorrin-2 dehydrogenase/sirohydrochlorin ferrochelatase
MTPKPLYPLFLDLDGKPVLVVGGGPVALRRAEKLVESGARVTVVSPEFVQGLGELRDAGAIRIEERRFAPPDMDGMALVLFATGDRQLAARAREEAARRRILFSSAESQELSDFHVPAVVSSGPASVAISTGGASPRAAARIRDGLAAWLRAAESFAREAALPGRGPAPARVYIVGAGPGDPALLTVKALAVLASAEVVYHDRLVSDAVLDVIPASARKVYVGKEVGCAHRANIHALLAGSAREGKRTVRLKGGDPLIFGRGGEEILALRREGIDFEVIAGVSALSSVPAAAGIPITLRGVAAEVIIRSGHRLASDRSGAGPAPGSGRTHIYFMAASRLKEVAAELLEEGLPPATPAAVIQKGTLPDQKVLRTTVGELGRVAARDSIETPALLVAGEVVEFHDLARFLELIEGEALQGTDYPDLTLKGER